MARLAVGPAQWKRGKAFRSEFRRLICLGTIIKLDVIHSAGLSVKPRDTKGFVITYMKGA